jgi:hypothetical protein
MTAILIDLLSRDACALDTPLAPGILAISTKIVEKLEIGKPTSPTSEWKVRPD